LGISSEPFKPHFFSNASTSLCSNQLAGIDWFPGTIYRQWRYETDERTADDGKSLMTTRAVQRTDLEERSANRHETQEKFALNYWYAANHNGFMSVGLVFYLVENEKAAEGVRES
jgi:hypothetical protein